MSGEIMKIMWGNLDLLWLTFRREYGWVSYILVMKTPGNDDDDDGNVNDDDRGGGRGGGG